MGSDQEAKDAVEKLNGQSLDGRAITVSEARPKEPRSDNYGGGGSSFREATDVVVTEEVTAAEIEEEEEDRTNPNSDFNTRRQRNCDLPINGISQNLCLL